MIATETETYQEQYGKFLLEQTLSTPTWLSELRQRGFKKFMGLGIPTRRIEDWRFTNIASLAGRPYHLSLPASLATSQIEELIERATLDRDFYRLVFVNGHYADEWSTLHDSPDGVVIESLVTAVRDRSAAVQKHFGRRVEFDDATFTALNTAFVSDGAFIQVPDDVLVARPIHLVYLSVGDGHTVTHPRNIIHLGKNSKACVIESYLGQASSGYFTNAVTELELDESAELDHHKLQHEHLGALHIAMTHVDQKSSSRFRSHYFSFGAALSRNEIRCVLDGEQIEATLNGLYMPTGEQLMDCRTRIDHLRPHCKSYELYKGVLNDRSKGVFNGKIFVHQDAQKTDAKQSNQALLLSDDAVVNTKPQLEIYADDVRCTHGATIGELDQKALYYLRSRGIPLELARKMLIFAFANDVVLSVDVPAVRQHLESILLSSHGLPNI